jgi:hypothetical protein
MITREQCRGCHDDFYNREDSRCWSAKTGKMMTRFQIHINQRPAEKGAYMKVKRPSCYHLVGSYVFQNRLPDFVKLEDVIGGKQS